MPAKKKNKQEQLAKDIADLVGAGKEWHLESVDFSDPNRPKTCLEVDFPIVPINRIAAIEGKGSGALKPVYQVMKWWARRRSTVFRQMLISAATKAPYDEDEAAKQAWDAYYGNHAKNSSFDNLRVADIFMGGGTTLVEGSRLGFKLFGNDLNPVAWKVVHNSLDSVNLQEVKSLYEHVESEVRAQLMPFYFCDGPYNEKGEWYLATEPNTPISLTSPWEIPYEERAKYGYSGPEQIYTFWARHGVMETLSDTHRTPIVSNLIVAQKTLTVYYWEATCPDSGKVYHVELGDARIAPDSALIVSGSETPFSVLRSDGNYSSPYTGKEYRDLSAAKRRESVSLGGKPKRKRISLTLLLDPRWMNGIPSVDKNGNAYGGSPRDPFEASLSWLNDRVSNDLFEFRGELPDRFNHTHQGQEIEFILGREGGNTPKDAHFICRKSGRLIRVTDSAQKYGKTLPWAPYAFQGVSEQILDNAPYNKGRFFAPAQKIKQQLIAASKEWNDRKDNDLSDYWPDDDIIEGQETSRLPRQKYDTWDKLFHDRQLLTHSLILKTIVEAEGYDVSTKDALIGVFQQYLRNNNVFCFWNTKRALEPFFSNNDYRSKNTSIENCTFSGLGRGDFKSCYDKLLDSLKWRAAPWEIACVHDDEHSEKVRTNDPMSINEAHLTCGSSTSLALESSSIDLIITDPPFGGLMQYSELSEFFYVWMQKAYAHLPEFSTRNAPNSLEAVANKFRAGSDADEFYERILCECWKEGNRILKDGGILAFTFHHSEDEPWIQVLRSLFDAGFTLVATYPIRSDESKAEGQFGSKLIEYDIIHVCRKRLDAPTRVSWARLRRRIMEDVRQLVNILEHHENEGLPDADLRVIKRGKALEYYSQHYGQVFVEHGREFSLKEALVGINQLLDDEDEQAADAPPITAEAFSRQFLRIFRRTAQIASDQMQKTLRGTGMSPADFEKRGWCKKEKKVFQMVSPLEWAQQWKGQNRKGMARDLDQTLFLIGACFEDSGIKVWDTLNSPNFRHHPAIPDLLEWFTSNGADNTVKAASHRARTIYLDWMERNKPEVEQAQAEFDFLKE